MARRLCQLLTCHQFCGGRPYGPDDLRLGGNGRRESLLEKRRFRQRSAGEHGRLSRPLRSLDGRSIYKIIPQRHSPLKARTVRGNRCNDATTAFGASEILKVPDPPL